MEKKKFEAPELTIILFTETDDIITTSSLGERYNAEEGDDWYF